jgi:glycine/D-amino acid oxidase-like deaminating enzyme
MDRRGFLRAASILGVGGAWFGGAHLYLKDDRWTPNRSFWVSRGRAPLAPPLHGTLDADIGILGAGVTGLSTAVHLLLHAPRTRVVVLDAEYAGFGATGRSGGVLEAGTEMGTPEGTEDNVERVIELIDRFAIDCDLDRDHPHIDPYRYAVGLRRAAVSLGAVVHEGTRVQSIRHGATVEARGAGFVLRAPRMVVATNGYTPRLGIATHRLFPVHTGAAVTPPLPPDVLAQLPDDLLVMTSKEMYMWGRKAPGGRLLVGSGASYTYDDGLYYDHDRFLFPQLRRVMLRKYPFLEPYPFEFSWTGPMGCTTDEEPILGRTGRDGNVLYGGGYTGQGLAMGTKNGLFLAGMLRGDAPPAWLLRPTLGLPGEPLRYIGVNMVINLMNLGLVSMPKND